MFHSTSRCCAAPGRLRNIPEESLPEVSQHRRPSRMSDAVPSCVPGARVQLRPRSDSAAFCGYLDPVGNQKFENSVAGLDGAHRVGARCLEALWSLPRMPPRPRRSLASGPAVSPPHISRVRRPEPQGRGFTVRASRRSRLTRVCDHSSVSRGAENASPGPPLFLAATGERS